MLRTLFAFCQLLQMTARQLRPQHSALASVAVGNIHGIVAITTLSAFAIILLVMSVTVTGVNHNLMNLDKHIQVVHGNMSAPKSLSAEGATSDKEIESSDQISINTVEKISTKKKAAEKIILLGERHSGTNWIGDYLAGCFYDNIEVTNVYMDFKHWFQDEDVQKFPEKSAVVVIMFRDPYMWVEAMRIKPYHLHSHFGLGWKQFVTKPLVGQKSEGLGLGRYMYELNHDGSGRAYSSIIDLRRDKIINFLSTANFVATRAFLPMRYEDLNANGTSILLRGIEEASGLKANCSAIMGKGHRQLRNIPITNHSKLSDEYIDWMNKFVDWEVESRIGYSRRVASDV